MHLIRSTAELSSHLRTHVSAHLLREELFHSPDTASHRPAALWNRGSVYLFPSTHLLNGIILYSGRFVKSFLQNFFQKSKSLCEPVLESERISVFS